MMSAKCTETRAESRFGNFSEQWMSSDTYKRESARVRLRWPNDETMHTRVLVLALLSRSFFARFPNTNSIASITLDFPEPFGPTMDENRL